MIRWLLCGATTAALILGSTVPARSDDTCWQLLYAAIGHGAAAPHAPYISYSELVNIQNDGHRFERANANITYRDDGLAWVDDDRWVHPFVSDLLEPGPPVLGPYGNRRDDWLAVATREYGIPLIADVHNPSQRQCNIAGDDVVNGVLTAHIVLPDAPNSQPALKEIWIDRGSLAISRLIAAEYLNIYTNTWNLVHPLTDFSIDMENVDGYSVVRRVTWKYSFKVYSQESTLDAQYDYTNYGFESAPPPGTLFGSSSGWVK
jgi:hypothetical protein